MNAADVRGASRALLLGFAVALVASLAITVERLTAMRPRAFMFAVAAVVFAAVLAMLAARELRRQRSAIAPLLVAHAIGAGLAIGLVHVAIVLAHPSGLVERPAQWMNDAVLAVSALSFAWGHAIRNVCRRLTLVVGATAVVLAYSATAAYWHCDLITFGQSVQRSVVQNALIVGMALFAVDLLVGRRPTRA